MDNKHSPHNAGFGCLGPSILTAISLPFIVKFGGVKLSFLLVVFIFFGFYFPYHIIRTIYRDLKAIPDNPQPTVDKEPDQKTNEAEQPNASMSPKYQIDRKELHPSPDETTSPNS